MRFLKGLKKAAIEERKPKKLINIVRLCLKKNYFPNPNGLNPEEFLDNNRREIVQELNKYKTECKKSGVPPLIEYYKGEYGLERITLINYKFNMSKECKFRQSGHVHRNNLINRILDELDNYSFQKFCKKLLERMGFRECKVGPRGQDGVLDFTGFHEICDKKVIGQAKAWKSKNVGVKPVRELHARVEKEDKNRSVPVIGLLITTSDFTHNARSWAEGLPLKLWDRRKLSAFLVEHEIGISRKDYPEASLDPRSPLEWFL